MPQRKNRAPKTESPAHLRRVLDERPLHTAPAQQALLRLPAQWPKRGGSQGPVKVA